MDIESLIVLQSLASIFRSRAGGDPQRDREKESTIDRCDVAIEDGPGVKSRFIVKLVFRNGMLISLDQHDTEVTDQ